MSNTAAIVPEAKAALKIEKRQIPRPGPGEMLIKNHAIAINPVDYKMQHYGIFIKQYPIVLGSDVSGTVEIAGDGVKHFQSGDRVAGFAAVLATGSNNHGAFQQYTLVQECCAAKLPASMSHDHGAILPMAVATAGIAIFVCLNIPRPTAQQKQHGGFLVWGGSSAVGSTAVQMAASLGFNVYAVSSPRHHDYIKTLGASKVFDHSQADVVASIVSSAKADGIEFRHALDAISEKGTSPKTAAVMEALGGGQLCLTLPWEADARKPANVTMTNTGAFKVATEHQDFSRWLFNEWLERALEDKTFEPSPAVERVNGGIDKLQAALDMAMKGLSGKKLVLPLEM